MRDRGLSVRPGDAHVPFSGGRSSAWCRRPGCGSGVGRCLFCRRCPWSPKEAVPSPDRCGSPVAKTSGQKERLRRGPYVAARAMKKKREEVRGKRRGGTALRARAQSRAAHENRAIGEGGKIKLRQTDECCGVAVCAPVRVGLKVVCFFCPFHKARKNQRVFLCRHCQNDLAEPMEESLCSHSIFFYSPRHEIGGNQKGRDPRRLCGHRASGSFSRRPFWCPPTILPLASLL